MDFTLYLVLFTFQNTLVFSSAYQTYNIVFTAFYSQIQFLKNIYLSLTLLIYIYIVPISPQPLSQSDWDSCNSLQKVILWRIG